MLLINCVSVYLIVVAVGIVSYATRIRTLSGAGYTKPLFLLSLSICSYILGYVMEMNASTSAQIVFWNCIEYTGIPFIAALWLTVSLTYCGYFGHHKKILAIAIYAIPFLTLVFRFTNAYHHLYFATTDFTKEFDRLIFTKTPGPWMYVQLVYSALAIVGSFVLLFMDILKSKQRQRGKLSLLIVAAAVILAGLDLPQGILFGIQIDYTALCLPITCMFVMMAISCYDFLEVKSLARSKAFEASSNAILLINCQNKIIDYNKSAETLFPKIHIQLTTQDIFSVFEGMPKLAQAIVREEPSAITEIDVGKETHYYNIVTERIDGHKALRGWVKIFLDVTEMYRFNEILRQQAMTDELSVLCNRRAFIKKGKELILSAEESGCFLHMIMLDLDHFKKINDQYGHLTGDFVIRDFSQILKRHFRTNCQVARLGGEEFAVLFTHYTAKEVYEMVQAFLSDAAQHEYFCFENRFRVTASVGMTSWKPGQLLEDVLRQADAALYQSKARGRNCVTIL